MLVLTRRVAQAIRIGDVIEVTVVRIEGDRVILGIRAPDEIRIVRAELVTAVEAETRAAAGAARRALDLLARDR